MDPKTGDWQRVKELFHAALAVPPAEREAFLADVCRNHGDDGIRREVERLVRAHAASGGFIVETPFGLTGRTLGRYEVGSLIGAGGMGEVYVARDIELRRRVAVKIAIAADPDAHARLKREAQSASQLNHPNICTIYEVGLHDGRPFIAMELVEGTRLSDAIGPEGLPSAVVLRYGAQIAAGVAHAHRHDVLHRDLKGANVVINSEQQAKILDFGLARRLPAAELRDLTSSREAIAGEQALAGTLSYMAPEVLRGEPWRKESDVWSLGVLLYEMTVGGQPFNGSTGFDLTGSILHESPPPLPERIPTALRAVVERCLEKDPEKRFCDGAAVHTALENVRIETRSPAGWPLPKTMAIAAVVVALVAAGVLWHRQRTSGEFVAPAFAGSSGNPAIAVMYFDVAGTRDSKDAWMAKGVPSMLVTGLAQTPGVDVVSTRRLQETVRQAGVRDLESLDRAQAADVARRAGAGAAVVGSIFASGNEIRIDAQLEDLASGQVILAESVRGTDLFTLVDQLAARIREGVGVRNSKGIRAVADISSPSIDAYRLYAQGVEAYNNMRLDDARRVLHEAVRIDPRFAGADLYLGLVNYLDGRPAERQAAFTRASAHMDRLSERHRLLLRAEVARDAGNAGEAERLVDDMVARFPDMEDAYPIVLHLYSPLTGIVYEPEKRIAMLAEGVRALPRTGVLRNLYGYALLEEGRLEKATEELEIHLGLAPNEPNVYDSLGEANLAAGRPDRALEHYRRALTVDPSFAAAHRGIALSLAMSGRYDDAIREPPVEPATSALLLSRVGRYREADRMLASAIDAFTAKGNVTGHASAVLMAALIAVERGDRAGVLTATRRARTVIASHPAAYRRLYMAIADLLEGIANARAGDMRAATENLASLQRFYNPDQIIEKTWRAALEGEIALAGNRFDEAAAAFLAAEPPRRVWASLVSDSPGVIVINPAWIDGPARVAAARGDVDAAAAIYSRLIAADPTLAWPALPRPLHLLELARLYQGAARASDAQRALDRFLDMWKDADPGRPEVAEARAAVVRLR